MKQETKKIKRVIFERYYIELNRANQVCQDLIIERVDFIMYCKQIDIERNDEIAEMRRLRGLYNNKLRLYKSDFEFHSFKEFYYWHLKTFEKQNGECYYCHTRESTIATLFKKKFVSAKRRTRGMHLEVERKDSEGNKYSPENCVLSCYFCNNDKSDVFTEEEYRRYLKNRKQFFDDEYKKLS